MKSFPDPDEDCNSRYVKRFIWNNSGLVCLLGILVLPVFLGVIAGLSFFILGFTAYRRFKGLKTTADLQIENSKRIQIVVGDQLSQSACPTTYPLEVQENTSRPLPLPPDLCKHFRISTPSWAFYTRGILPQPDVQEEDVESGSFLSDDSVFEQEGEEERVDEGTELQGNPMVEVFSPVNDIPTSPVRRSPGHARIVELSPHKSSPVRNSPLKNSPMKSSPVKNSPLKGSQGKGSPQKKDSSEKSTREEVLEEKLNELEQFIENNFPNKPRSGSKGKVHFIEEIEKQPLTDEVPTTRGKLRFSIGYSCTKNQLHVSVFKASDLLIRSEKEDFSTCVQVCLSHQPFCWQRTNTIENTSSPVFNESFTISGFSKDKIFNYTIILRVVNPFNECIDYYKSDVIGEVRVPLTDMTSKSKDDYIIHASWKELRGRRRINIETCRVAGEVLVSLCYRPISGRLIITIVRAVGLPKAENGRTDPYAKVAIFCDGLKLDRANTRIKKNSLKPLFNEKFNFNISNDVIHLTTVEIRMTNQANASTGASHIGTTVVGFDSDGSGQRQWIQMLDSPNRHVDYWHKIYADT